MSRLPFRRQRDAPLSVWLYREESGYSAVVHVLNVAPEGPTIKEALATAHDVTRRVGGRSIKTRTVSSEDGSA